MTKNTILNQIRLNRAAGLLSEGMELDYFPRIIEEINARNYPRLAALSVDYGISLTPLYRVLERKASEFLRADTMPRSCEIAVLQLILSPQAGERRLTALAPPKELDEQDIVSLYFMIFSPQFSEDDIGRLNTMLEEFNLKKLRDHIFDHGIQRWFNSRYRSVKSTPEENLMVHQVIDEIGLPVVFDENLAVRRYVSLKMERDSRARDMKEDLYLENSLRTEAAEKIRRLYELFENYPCDFQRMKEMMLDLRMERELTTIELEGINHLKDYVRSKSAIGAQEVALRYDFVAPATSGDDLAQARRTIAGSFLGQALKSKKGKIFLRAEALYNLQSDLCKGHMHQVAGGYLIAILSTADQSEHYLVCRCSARSDQVNFALLVIGSFLCHPSSLKAARVVVKAYMESLAGEIRAMNALKKTLYSLPLVLTLALIVGMVYFFTLGGVAGSVALGAVITLIGAGIAAKNGYDEDFTPSSHERIPEYLCREKGKVTPAQLNAETFAQVELNED